MTELAEESLGRVHHGLGIERVDHLLSAALVDDEVRLLQNGQMSRNRRLCESEVVHDLADAVLALLQDLENVAAGLIGESLEEVVHLTAPLPLFHVCTHRSDPPTSVMLSIAQLSLSCVSRED